MAATWTIKVTRTSSAPPHEMQEPRFPAPPSLRVVSVETYLHDVGQPTRVIHPDPGVKVVLKPTAWFRGGWYRLEVQFPPDGVVDVVAQFVCVDGSQFWHRLPVIDRNSFSVTLRIGAALERLVLRISGSGYLVRPIRFFMGHLDAISWVRDIARTALNVVKRRRLGIVQSGANFVRILMQRETIVVRGVGASAKEEAPYQTWLRLFDEAPERCRGRHEERLQSLDDMPLISCLATIAGLDDLAIARLAQGMREQIYPRWELLVAVPEKLASSVRQALKGLPSFRIIAAANDMSSTLNALLKEASGPYILKIPDGALLRPNALLELAMTIALYPAAELIYSDEDQIDRDGRRFDPKFKPAWSPDFFGVYDYIGQLTLLRRETALAVGGWRDFSSTAIDYDLKLRVTDQAESQNIIHIAKVLISCPAVSSQNSINGRAEIERMLCDHIERRHLPADVVWREGVCLARLRYRIPVPAPLASIIIPTRDRADLLEKCVRSILAHTRYPSIEILIVDNGSVDPTTHRLFAELARQDRIRILSSPGQFNYSALNNFAAREASGTILALLNNDIEVISGDWLEEMVALAARREIGCVGAKLLYPDGRIQHAGVYLGFAGLAVHAYRLGARNSSGRFNRMSTIQNVTAVTAACLTIRKSVFDGVGGFDERELKVALNDVDLCLKVRAAGYLNLWTPFAELVHHESVSRGRDARPARARRLGQERNVLRARWGEALVRDPYYSPNLTDDREDFSVRVH
jgi:GT2 family glycosyltransferase